MMCRIKGVRRWNQAIETFGDLTGIVSNAGILRDRMLVNMTEAEWDAVIQVHLKGTFAPARWAAAYWRDKAKLVKKSTPQLSIRLLFRNLRQSWSDKLRRRKMGIAAFTIIAARNAALRRRANACSGSVDSNDGRLRYGSSIGRGQSSDAPQIHSPNCYLAAKR